MNADQLDLRSQLDGGKLIPVPKVSYCGKANVIAAAAMAEVPVAAISCAL